MGAEDSTSPIRVLWGPAWEAHSLLKAEDKITVSFPDAMVGDAEVGVPNVKCPIRWSPDLPGEWIWKSPTEGQFQIGSLVIPSTKYQILLVKGLTAVSGAQVKASKAVGARESAPFEVTAETSSEKLEKRPTVTLEFSYPVFAKQVAQVVTFQDRDSRKLFPAEVELLEADSGQIDPKVRSLRVMPREDLPIEHTFDLIVENVREAETRTKLSNLKVFPLGETEPLKVQKVWTSNVAIEKPQVHVLFNEPVDVSEGKKIRFEPPVEGLFFTAREKELIAEGPFLKQTRYRVEVPTTVVGKRGFPLVVESVWGAPFHPKTGAVLFPEDALSFYYGNSSSAPIFLRHSTAGVTLPFIQVNTGELRWRLASVPPETVPAVSQRLLEFLQQRTDPVSEKELFDEDTGLPLKRPTELLIDSSHLPVIAEGSFPESFGDEDTSREIRWTPNAAPPMGVCLLEIAGKNAKGQTIGNRALINFTDFSVLQKDDGDNVLLRIVHLGDGSPLGDARVRAVSKNNLWIAEDKTDAAGMVRLPKRTLFPTHNPGATFESGAACYLIDTPTGTVREPVHPGFVHRYRPHPNSGSHVDGKAADYRVTLIPDRPLYRPGQVVHFKGFVRAAEQHGSVLRVPPTVKLQWSIEDAKEESGSVHSAEAQTDDFGGFEGEWKIPDALRVGSYLLRAQIPGTKVQPFEAPIAVEEFRAPPFTVDLEKIEKAGPVAGLHIQSQLFHGAPNAGAKVRWTASWREIVRGYDSEETANEEARAQGEGALDAQGRLDLEVPNPFVDQRTRGWFRVAWMVNVVGTDGQTIAEPALTNVHASPVLLKARAASGGPQNIRMEVEAWNGEGEAQKKFPVEVEVTREMQKTVREEITAHVFRLVQTVVKEKVTTVSGSTPLREKVQVPGPGTYRIFARAKQNAAVPVVSDDTVIHGTEAEPHAEFWQPDPRNFSLESDKPIYRSGETAVLTASAPFAGKVWVSLECDSVVMDSFTTELTHNAGRLEIPMKDVYFPNVWAHVYLLKPGGKGALPSECVGSVELKMQRPELALDVASTLESKDVEPGKTVKGSFTVRVGDQPVRDADVTLYAVDDALLVAGGWHAPNLNAALYIPRPWGIHSATSSIWRFTEGLSKSGGMQKGFIIGGGGDDEMAGSKKTVRKNFIPLAHWQTGLRTDAEGRLNFSFPAPDSLTRYRIVALAQTQESAFGVGQETVEISKKIQIEPAMPRFVRNGDELELRALVRQKLADSLNVTVRCSGSLALSGEHIQTREVRRNEPGIFRFRAKVGDDASGTVVFSTTAGGGDSVEMHFPVHPPTLLRRESVFAAIHTKTAQSTIASVIPEHWDRAIGSAAVNWSTSAWLPSIAALPRVLEYPHGCTEQISSRILGYTLLGDLIEYLPDDGERDRSYRARVSKGLERLSAIVLPNGGLPYWPGGSESAFSTVIGYWAAYNAMSKDWAVPEKLLEKLELRVREMAFGKDASVSTFIRCFAVLALSSSHPEEQTLEPVIRDLYAKRREATDEARAFLAVAMFQLGISQSQREQLLREIDRPLQTSEFDSYSFSSMCRTEAIRAWAFATVHPEDDSGRARLKLVERISHLLESAESLSTQENFWLLMAFRALHAHAQMHTPDLAELRPKPDAISKNKKTAAWKPMPIGNVRSFLPRLPVSSSGTLHALWTADYRMPSKTEDHRMDRGLRLERVVTNRTDPLRTGTKDAPFKLGDELLVSLRLLSPKLHHYVAFEAELPGCFEAVNPHVPSVGKSFHLPSTSDEGALTVSYSEMRDKVVNVYVDRVNQGVGAVFALVRVTSAGVFTWPPAQVAPMYDARFSGLSAGSECHVVE